MSDLFQVEPRRPLAEALRPKTLAEVIGRTGNPLAAPRTGPLPLFKRREGLKVKLTTDTRWAKASRCGSRSNRASRIR